MASREHEFALYAGDEFLMSGTAKDIAGKLGVLPEHIRYLSTPAHQRRLDKSKRPTGRAKYAIKLGLPDQPQGESHE